MTTFNVSVYFYSGDLRSFGIVIYVSALNKGFSVKICGFDICLLNSFMS